TLAGNALLGLHLLLRIPRQLGRAQAHGAGALWRAQVRAAYPLAARGLKTRRIVSDGHAVFQLLPRADNDLALILEAVRRSAAPARGAPDPTRNGSGGFGAASNRRDHASRRAIRPSADRSLEPVPGRRRRSQLCRQRQNCPRRAI